MVVGTKSSTPGPSEDLQGPKKGILRPKQAPFACFLKLGGSKGAITVLDEQGIPLRCSGSGPNSPFWTPRSKCVMTVSPTQMSQSGAVETKSGPTGPFEDPKGLFGPKRALLGPPGAQKAPRYQVKVCGDHESNPDGPMGSSWDQIWPLGALQGPPGPPKGPFGPEMSPFGGPRSALEVR